MSQAKIDRELNSTSAIPLLKMLIIATAKLVRTYPRLLQEVGGIAVMVEMS